MIPSIKPILIGITGGTGSGKSEFAHWLQERLAPHATLFCQDWYYHDRSNASPNERINFDHPDAIDHALMAEHLHQLLQGQGVDVPQYDYVTHGRMAQTLRLEPNRVILIEGLFVLHFKEVLECLDHSVFIDVPADVRLARRLERDFYYRQRPMAVTLQMYNQSIRTMHEAFIQPTLQNAKAVWRQLEESSFPQQTLELIHQKMAHYHGGELDATHSSLRHHEPALAQAAHF